MAEEVLGCPLFSKVLVPSQKLDHVRLVMGHHPIYLDQFLKTECFILQDGGPLPYIYRHYIAIMAAGRHHCAYMIELQKQEFLREGGSESWLLGLNHIPQKLRNLYEINKILAHRPWLISKKHIDKLLNGKDHWSLAELVHAIVILVHFHSLCSFVFSCGLHEEIDEAVLLKYGIKEKPIVPTCCKGFLSRSDSTELEEFDETGEEMKETTVLPSSSSSEPPAGIKALMQRMRNLSEKARPCSPVELAKTFEHVETQSAEIDVVGLQPQDTPTDICCFIEDPKFQYVDFAKRIEHQKAEEDVDVFCIHDYSWVTYGYSIANRLCNDVGRFLDDKFQTVYNLTYHTLGGRVDVDTTMFRTAIWNYVQCLLGIRYDDYDYGEVDVLMEKSLKTFIKTACCYPERITKKEYDKVLKEFHPSEKIHVCMMILESRMQAGLLYALRSINSFITR